MDKIKVYKSWGETVNGFVPEFMNFSAGEVHLTTPISIKMKDNLDEVWVVSNIQSSEDLMRTLVVTNAIHHEVNYGTKVNLLLPYLPYSRSDRVCAKGEEFGLETLAQIINTQNYDKVVTFDAHSKVAATLINNFFDVGVEWLLSQHLTLNNLSYDVLLSPDKGALDKVIKCGEMVNLPVTQGFKVRDPSTGKLSGFGLTDGDKLVNKKVLIVDDLCDGGGTFIGLLQEVKKFSPKSVDLFVTHGIFSKGIRVLEESGFSSVDALHYFSNNLNTDDETLDCFISDIIKGEFIYD